MALHHSNAGLPPLTLSIPNFKKIHDKENDKEYVEYNAVISDGSAAWRKGLRYSELEKLHDKISERYQGLPSFPNRRNIFQRLSDSGGYDERRTELEKYLQILAQHPKVRTSPEFLSVVSVPLQWALPLVRRPMPESIHGVWIAPLLEHVQASLTELSKLRATHEATGHVSDHVDEISGSLQKDLEVMETLAADTHSEYLYFRQCADIVKSAVQWVLTVPRQQNLSHGDVLSEITHEAEGSIQRAMVLREMPDPAQTEALRGHVASLLGQVNDILRREPHLANRIGDTKQALEDCLSGLDSNDVARDADAYRAKLVTLMDQLDTTDNLKRLAEEAEDVVRGATRALSRCETQPDVAADLQDTRESAATLLRAIQQRMKPGGAYAVKPAKLDDIYSL